MECDVNTVAQALELSPRRVQQLVEQDWLPRERPGVYNLADCLTAYTSFLEEVQDGGEIAAARARKTAAKAEVREIELAVEDGGLVDLNEAQKERVDALSQARARLQNLPSLAPRVVNRDGEEREAMIRQELEEALAALEGEGETRG